MYLFDQLLKLFFFSVCVFTACSISIIFFCVYVCLILFYIFVASRHHEHYEGSKTIEDRSGHPLIER